MVQRVPEKLFGIMRHQFIFRIDQPVDNFPDRKDPSADL
jgi:hypothetical protein